MSYALPTVRSDAPLLYPLQDTSSFNTKVRQFCDDSEQRWLVRKKFKEFMLTYDRIPMNDVNNLLSFWNLVKGSYDSTWTMTVNGVTYSDMHFVNDVFSLTEVSPGLFNLSFQCAQQLVA